MGRCIIANSVFRFLLDNGSLTTVLHLPYNNDYHVVSGRGLLRSLTIEAIDAAARFRYQIAALFLCLFVSSHDPLVAFSQSADPKKIEIFREDDSKFKDALQKKRQGIVSVDKSKDQDLDVKAPQIEFLKDTSVIKATGGALISGKGIQAQAGEALVNTETKTGELHGNIIFSGPSAAISAKDASVNFEDETGEFKFAEFEYADGGYRVRADSAFKLSETKYKLFDSKFSTCHCEDGSCPWSIDSSESRITQEGYVVAKDTTLDVWGVPVFYTPYFAFPAKMERASGLLVPTYGFSSEDGFKFKQPVFLVLDDSTDTRVTPFTETKTRNGVLLDGRKLFSKDNKIETHITYSNESPRGDDLRGSLTDGLVDNTFEFGNRYGVYYNQLWKADKDAALPVKFIADGHYVSDVLLVREMPNYDIGDPTSRFLTSSVITRSMFGEYFSGEILGEYTQPIVGKLDAEDTVFHRAPEASVSFLRSFKAFGSNPYGLRLVTKGSLTETSFIRDEGYDGLRTAFNPTASIPFHIKNYLQGSFGGGTWVRQYSVDNIDGTELEDSDSNNVPYIQTSLGTAFERAYELPEENILTTLTSLGASNQDLKLARVKHVIEPNLRYTHIPDVDQDDLPAFDSLDRISQKSLLRYGVSTSLLGRFVPRRDALTGIPELTPETRDLPRFDSIATIPDFGELDQSVPVSGDISLRNGELRELLTLSLDQGYDWRADEREKDEREKGGTDTIYNRTDLTTGLGISPTSNTQLKVETYYNSQESRFTGWGALGKILDDRGDNISARYSFKGPALGHEDDEAVIDQLDGGIEAVLTERIRIGTYARYDNIEDEFINRRAAIRLKSECNCWHFDLGYSQKLNPDKQTFYLTFSFTGLGDVTQDLYSWGGDEF